MDPNQNTNQPNLGSPKPVAYDQNGNPLYAQPPSLPPPPQQPQHVHLSRAVNPAPENIPPEILKRHEESQKKYPHINLSRGEFILSAVRRHPIGLLNIWFIGLGLIATFMAMYFLLFGPGASGEVQDLAGAALAV